MKALTFHGKQIIKYESVPDPKIEHPKDVIVKVLLAAICGSDLHIYHERETGLDYGTVMGHEFVGEIVEIGSEAKSFQIGDIVSCPFTTNCGECFFCRIGLTARCTKGQLFGWVEDGRGLHGGQAEYVRIPLADLTLLRLPKVVSLEEGLLLGDIFSTGYFCAEMADIHPNGTYAIVGCGPVGLLAIFGARDFGAEKIYAIDSVPERLTLAEKFGAVPLNYQNENPIEIIHKFTDGRGADAVLEVVGNKNAGRLAFDLVRPGGIISTVGVHTEKEMAFSPVEAYNKNITYKIGRCPARFYMEKLLPIVQSKKYDLAAIISHRLPLAEGVRGYEIFDKKLENCIKVVLEP
ncbi:MAG: alcohol dehydrogenase family protein [bacterium]|nr:alcohol dehydrogenase family protein [bacterium]